MFTLTLLKMENRNNTTDLVTVLEVVLKIILSLAVLSPLVLFNVYSFAKDGLNIFNLMFLTIIIVISLTAFVVIRDDIKENKAL